MSDDKIEFANSKTQVECFAQTDHTHSNHTHSNLSSSQWQDQLDAHEKKLSPFINRFRYWRTHGLKHPVYDFLFSYYSFSSGQLLRWSPGVGIGFEARSLEKFKWSELIKVKNNLAFIDSSFFPERRIPFLKWAIKYLENTSLRPPVFHCFGLHEWAMVYKTDARHHPQIPLRISSDEVSKQIESQPLCCSHYDAFRFFSQTAVPLNRYQLSRESVVETDQPGCLHANMDLYKMGYKIAPFICSNLLADLFLLARYAREIDMRASPYDLTQFEMQPILIETKEGRETYVQEQKKLYDMAQVQRARLIRAYNLLLKEVSGNIC